MAMEVTIKQQREMVEPHRGGCCDAIWAFVLNDYLDDDIADTYDMHGWEKERIQYEDDEFYTSEDDEIVHESEKSRKYKAFVKRAERLRKNLKRRGFTNGQRYPRSNHHSRRKANGPDSEGLPGRPSMQESRSQEQYNEKRYETTDKYDFPKFEFLDESMEHPEEHYEGCSEGSADRPIASLSRFIPKERKIARRVMTPSKGDGGVIPDNPSADADWDPPPSPKKVIKKIKNKQTMRGSNDDGDLKFNFPSGEEWDVDSKHILNNKFSTSLSFNNALDEHLDEIPHHPSIGGNWKFIAPSFSASNGRDSPPPPDSYYIPDPPSSHIRRGIDAEGLGPMIADTINSEIIRLQSAETKSGDDWDYSYDANNRS